MRTKENTAKPGTKRWVNALLTAIFTVIAVIYVMPIVVVIINSFKATTTITTSPFALPNGETFVGFQNYIEGITSGNYPFYKAVLNSIVITVLSTGRLIFL